MAGPSSATLTPTAVPFNDDLIQLYRIAGMVRRNAIPLAGWTVRAYRRDTGDLVGASETTSNGRFSIFFWNLDAPLYAVAFLLSDETTSNNIYPLDNLRPVAVPKSSWSTFGEWRDMQNWYGFNLGQAGVDV